MNLEYLDPPQLVVLSETEGQDERRVSNWITEWDFEEEIDVGIIGVPMDTSTMVDSVLTETPNNVRKAFVHFTTFNPDFGVDVQGLKVRYVGDVGIHQTYVEEKHSTDGGYASTAVRVQFVIRSGRAGRGRRGYVAGGYRVCQGDRQEAGHSPLRLPQRHAQPGRGEARPTSRR